MGRFLSYLSNDTYTYKTSELRVAHYNIPAEKVIASSANGLLKTKALGAAGLVVDTFLTEMPYAMNLIMVCSGTQKGVATAYGKDMNGEAISEAFTLTDDASVVGALAFAKLEKVVLPIKVGSETISIGWGVKFGLPYKLTTLSQVIAKLFNKTADEGTVTVDSEVLAKNVLALNGTADGKKDIDMYILV